MIIIRRIQIISSKFKLIFSYSYFWSYCQKWKENLPSGCRRGKHFCTSAYLHLFVVYLTLILLMHRGKGSCYYNSSGWRSQIGSQLLTWFLVINVVSFCFWMRPWFYVCLWGADVGIDAASVITFSCLLSESIRRMIFRVWFWGRKWNILVFR